ALNPNGIPAQNPGSRGTSLAGNGSSQLAVPTSPGLADKTSINPVGVAPTGDMGRNGSNSGKADSYKEQTSEIRFLDIGHSDDPRRPYLQSEKNPQTNGSSLPSLPSVQSGPQAHQLLPAQNSAPSSVISAPSVVKDALASLPLLPSVQNSAMAEPYLQTE